MTANDIGLAILHVATGVFFVTTGTRKCFLPDVRAKVCQLFDSHHVPKPLQYLVMAGEFLGGMGLLTGTLTRAAAVGLTFIMLGAYVLDTWASVLAKNPAPRSPSKLLSNALCTPEAQLLVIVLALAFTGPGAFSLDHLLFG